MAKTYDVHLVLSDDEDAMMKKLKKVYFQNSDSDELTMHEITTLLTYAIHYMDIHVKGLMGAIDELKNKQ